MFAGIVEEAATITQIERKSGLTRLSVQTTLDIETTKLGDSICIEGVCLTVVEKKQNSVLFELSDETLRRSTLGGLQIGARVNFERSLKVGSRIDGHFVFGHVDGTAELLSREPDGECERLTWGLPEALIGFVAEKGSVSLGGVSLTVGEVGKDRFSVYIIPHTAQVTTLGDVPIGGRVNFEVDMLARYVHAALRGRGSQGS